MDKTYFAPLDHNNNERYNHAVCDVDVYRATNLPAGGYCVEFRGNDCLKVTISYPKSKNNVDYKTVTNICCKLDGQEVPGLRRGYFEMKNDAPEVSVQIRFKDEEALQKNEGKSQEIKAYNYSLKLKRTRPVVFIHDAGDGPILDNQEEGSYALNNISKNMPYVEDFQPMKLFEFPWKANDAEHDFEWYANKDGLLHKSLDANFKNWPLKPMFICNGVGGLILTKLMENSEDVAKNIRGIVFLATPFFGSQIANHIRVDKDVDSEFLEKLRVMASVDRYIKFSNISNDNLDRLCNGTELVWKRRDNFALEKHSKYLNLDTTHVFFGDASLDLHITIQEHASAYANKMRILTPCLSAAVGVVGVALCFGPGTQAGGVMLLAYATYAAGMATMSYMSAQEAWEVHKFNVRVDGMKIIKDIFDIHGDGIVSISSADLPRNMGWKSAKRHCLDGYNHGNLSIVKFPLEDNEEDKVITVIKELAKETDEEKSK